jgi:hypothetical protein
MPSEKAAYVAIELSLTSWLWAARVPGIEKPRLHRLEGATQRRCSKRSGICDRRLRPSWAAQLTWYADLRLAGMDSGCTDC